VHSPIAPDSVLADKIQAMVVILMGVVGVGKTTIGKLLAAQLSWDFADADDYHSPASIEKIRHGVSLTDQDREPWLERLRQTILGRIHEGRNLVLACSALKAAYREKLQAGPEVRFVYLKGSAALIARRLHERHGHFATESILAGQFADLEEPADALAIEVSKTPDEIVARIRQGLHLE
jgi:gluconokinase